MNKRAFWKAADKSKKRQIAASADTSVEYLRQVFMYDRACGAKKARLLSAATDGAIGAHEFCPDAFSESDSLSIKSETNTAA